MRSAGFEQIFELRIFAEGEAVSYAVCTQMTDLPQAAVRAR